MLKSEIQRNRFYMTNDNRIVLPRGWDQKKRRWWVNPSRRGSSAYCKSNELLREITPDEAEDLMLNAQYGLVPRLLELKKIAAEVGVNVILPWEPLPKDYVPEKRTKRKDRVAEAIHRWL